jgi:hypothetical protein
VGEAVDPDVGSAVGPLVGNPVGPTVGPAVETPMGDNVGRSLVSTKIPRLGATDGGSTRTGAVVGAASGFSRLGVADGDSARTLGALVRDAEGPSVRSTVGTSGLVSSQAQAREMAYIQRGSFLWIGEMAHLSGRAGTLTWVPQLKEPTNT